MFQIVVMADLVKCFKITRRNVRNRHSITQFAFTKCLTKARDSSTGETSMFAAKSYIIRYQPPMFIIFSIIHNKWWNWWQHFTFILFFSIQTHNTYIMNSASLVCFKGKSATFNSLKSKKILSNERSAYYF